MATTFPAAMRTSPAPVVVEPAHLAPAPRLGAPPLAAPAPPAKQRDALIDNTRFVLIVLVVLGHLLTTMREDSVMNVLYTWIYMFHMPGFVFLAGLVIGSSALDTRAGARIISGILAPLLVFTALYEVFGRLIGQPIPSDSELIDPFWLLWFLAALALWRLCVPALRSLRWPVATTLLLATVLTLFTDLPSTWSIDRFIVLMPFFAAGLVLTPGHIRVVRTRMWQVTSLGIVAASVPIALWIADGLPIGFISFTDGVTSVGDVPEFLGMYLIASSMIVALLALIPSGRGRITVWGTRTLYVYLLHGFFVRAFRASDLSAWLDQTVGLLLILAISLGLAILLSSDRVVELTHRLVQPDVSWVLGDQGPSQPSTPVGVGTPDPDDPDQPLAPAGHPITQR